MTYDLARVRGAITLAHAHTTGAVKTPKMVSEEVERLMPGATLVSTSGFGDAVIAHM